MRKLGFDGAELRTIKGQSVLDVSREELDRALEAVRENQLDRVVHLSDETQNAPSFRHQPSLPAEFPEGSSEFDLVNKIQNPPR